MIEILNHRTSKSLCVEESFDNIGAVFRSPESLRISFGVLEIFSALAKGAGYKGAAQKSSIPRYTVKSRLESFRRDNNIPPGSNRLIPVILRLVSQGLLDTSYINSLKAHLDKCDESLKPGLDK